MVFEELTKVKEIEHAMVKGCKEKVPVNNQDFNDILLC